MKLNQIPIPLWAVFAIVAQTSAAVWYISQRDSDLTNSINTIQSVSSSVDQLQQSVSTISTSVTESQLSQQYSNTYLRQQLISQTDYITDLQTHILNLSARVDVLANQLEQSQHSHSKVIDPKWITTSDYTAKDQ